MTMVIDGLKYSEDHEWVKLEGSKAYIGITDYAQHALGDLVYVELPEEGDSFEQGDSFGVIESVKAASDAYMPISGKIVEINSTVVDDPASLNADAYANWLIAVEVTDMAQVEALMDAAAYRAHLGGE